MRGWVETAVIRAVQGILLAAGALYILMWIMTRIENSASFWLWVLG